MPQVTIKTGITDKDGHEEVLHAYLCDWPDCPNEAVHALGVIRELRVSSALCDEHFTALKSQKKPDQER
jgi:hypothetical protein